MKYFKVVSNGYIWEIGTTSAFGSVPGEIEEPEYSQLKNVFEHPPVKDGYYYVLKTDLTWEERPVEPSPEPTVEDKAEAYDILMGVGE